MKLRSGLIGGAMLALLSTAPATAIPFDVNAFANSTTGGVGVNTISLTAGQSYTVSVALTDLWNAGNLPRWSNADGLIGPDRFATGTDDSGQLAGTKIGEAFPLWTQGGLTAPFGALVGRIAGGNFFLIGTNFSGVAAATGVLQLFYFDSNFHDNTDKITADVVAGEQAGSPVPLPGALPLFASGLGAIGALAWRRKRKAIPA